MQIMPCWCKTFSWHNGRIVYGEDSGFESRTKSADRD